MKKFVFIGLLVLAGCFSGFVMNFSEKDIKNEKNVLVNPSFENGFYSYNEIPEGWMVMDKPNGTIFWDKDVHNSGEKSLKIENPRKTIRLISDSFVINPGAVYYIRAFVKSDRITSKQITLQFIVFDKEGKKVNVFGKKFFIEDKWTKLSLTAGFFKSSAKFARIIISIPRKPDVTFWIDDVEVYNIHSFMKRK